MQIRAELWKANANLCQRIFENIIPLQVNNIQQPFCCSCLLMTFINLDKYVILLSGNWPQQFTQNINVNCSQNMSSDACIHL